MQLRLARRGGSDRQGATILETAFVLPVMFVLMFGLMEFARAFMTLQMINAAARQGAYMCILDGVSNAEAEAAMRNILASGHIDDGVIIEILDGTPVDETEPGGDPPSTDDLSPWNLPDAIPRQLLIVRIQVPFDRVALITPWWLGDATISGQMAMRHE